MLLAVVLGRVLGIREIIECMLVYVPVTRHVTLVAADFIRLHVFLLKFSFCRPSGLGDVYPLGSSFCVTELHFFLVLVNFSWCKALLLCF